MVGPVHKPKHLVAHCHFVPPILCRCNTLSVRLSQRYLQVYCHSMRTNISTEPKTFLYRTQIFGPLLQTLAVSLCVLPALCCSLGLLAMHHLVAIFAFRVAGIVLCWASSSVDLLVFRAMPIPPLHGVTGMSTHKRRLIYHIHQ